LLKSVAQLCDREANNVAHKIYIIRVFLVVLGTRFASLEFQIGSLESDKIIIGSLQIQTGFLTFSLNTTLI